jgi:hypothetical protein
MGPGPFGKTPEENQISKKTGGSYLFRRRIRFVMVLLKFHGQTPIAFFRSKSFSERDATSGRTYYLSFNNP